MASAKKVKKAAKKSVGSKVSTAAGKPAPAKKAPVPVKRPAAKKGPAAKKAPVATKSLPARKGPAAKKAAKAVVAKGKSGKLTLKVGRHALALEKVSPTGKPNQAPRNMALFIDLKKYTPAQLKKLHAFVEEYDLEPVAMGKGFNDPTG